MGYLCMDLIQLKIKKDNSLVKYIKIIREFDSSLSVSDIKQRIDENDFVVGFDLHYYDVLEDINGIDRKKIFRDMIEALYEAGAHISIYQNGELSSIELLDNWLQTLDEIMQQAEKDMDRESFIMDRQTISDFEKENGIILPERYIQFLLDCDNQPEKICKDYLRIGLYAFDVFVEMQEDFEMKAYCPEYVAIGSGSGGEILVMEQKRDANTLIITEAGNLLSEYITPQHCAFFVDFFDGWVNRGCLAADIAL